MGYQLKINADSSIEGMYNPTINENDIPDGVINITDEDAKVIINSRYGHSVFNYMNNVITLNQDLYNVLMLNDNKTKYINELIENEIVLMARERITAKIKAVNEVINQTALDALKT